MPQLHARVSAYHHHLTMDLLGETGRPEREPQNTQKLEETTASSKLPRNFGENFVAFVVVSDYLLYKWED